MGLLPLFYGLRAFGAHYVKKGLQKLTFKSDSVSRS
jgi:hypothetical protein